MKYCDLDYEQQNQINYIFDKFIEDTFEYVIRDYELMEDFLKIKAKWFKEELEYETLHS